MGDLVALLSLTAFGTVIILILAIVTGVQRQVLWL